MSFSQTELIDLNQVENAVNDSEMHPDYASFYQFLTKEEERLNRFEESPQEFKFEVSKKECQEKLGESSDLVFFSGFFGGKNDELDKENNNFLNIIDYNKETTLFNYLEYQPDTQSKSKEVSEAKKKLSKLNLALKNQSMIGSQHRFMLKDGKKETSEILELRKADEEKKKIESLKKMNMVRMKQSFKPKDVNLISPTPLTLVQPFKLSTSTKNLFLNTKREMKNTPVKSNINSSITNKIRVRTEKAGITLGTFNQNIVLKKKSAIGINNKDSRTQMDIELKQDSIDIGAINDLSNSLSRMCNVSKSRSPDKNIREPNKGNCSPTSRYMKTFSIRAHFSGIERTTTFNPQRQYKMERSNSQSEHSTPKWNQSKPIPRSTCNEVKSKINFSQTSIITNGTKTTSSTTNSLSNFNSSKIIQSKNNPTEKMKEQFIPTKSKPQLALGTANLKLHTSTSSSNFTKTPKNGVKAKEILTFDAALSKIQSKSKIN